MQPYFPEKSNYGQTTNGNNLENEGVTYQVFHENLATIYQLSFSTKFVVFSKKTSVF